MSLHTKKLFESVSGNTKIMQSPLLPMIGRTIIGEDWHKRIFEDQSHLHQPEVSFLIQDKDFKWSPSPSDQIHSGNPNYYNIDGQASSENIDQMFQPLQFSCNPRRASPYNTDMAPPYRRRLPPATRTAYFVSVSKHTKVVIPEGKRQRLSAENVKKQDKHCNSEASTRASVKDGTTMRNIELVKTPSLPGLNLKHKLPQRIEDDKEAMLMHFTSYNIGIFTDPKLMTNIASTDIFKLKTFGECLIRDLIVKHEDHGGVLFEGLTTLSLNDFENLEKLLIFTDQGVAIYPPDTAKPPHGQGLNRPALILLKNIWPRNTVTNKLISHPDEAETNAFKNCLKATCERIKGQFVNYYPDHGVWTFKVQLH